MEDGQMTVDLRDGLAGGNRHHTEQVVMWRILLDGIRTLDGEDGQAAEEWLGAADGEGPMSFENLCVGLGVDADALRAAIALRRTRREAKGEARVQSLAPPAGKRGPGTPSRRNVVRRHHRTPDSSFGTVVSIK
jgi:hypothetical protein